MYSKAIEGRLFISTKASVIVRSMSPRLICSFLVCVAGLGCSETNPNGSSSSSVSSSGEMPVPPPMKVVWTETSMVDAPTARYGHTAVWTGTKMIIWGGNTGGMPTVTNTGGIYDPVTNTWKPTSVMGAPAARWGHVAVWTGTKMLVWSGFGASNLESAGGIYDPEADTWAPMSTAGQPALRSGPAAVWTGTKMVVWGGRVGPDAVKTGGIYDFAKDSWNAVNEAGGPSKRYYHRLDWSGSRVFVWGGSDSADWFNTGAFLDPDAAPTGIWTHTSSTTNPPLIRDRHSLTFGNGWFVAWAGWDGGNLLNTGGMIKPDDNKWVAMTETGAPSIRYEHAAVWADTHVVAWGGCGESLCTAQGMLGDGGQFVPNSNGGTWYPIESQAALSARYSHTIVSTGSGVIVWGGRSDPQTRTNTGAYAPL